MAKYGIAYKTDLIPSSRSAGMKRNAEEAQEKSLPIALKSFFASARLLVATVSWVVGVQSQSADVLKASLSILNTIAKHAPDVEVGGVTCREGVLSAVDVADLLNCLNLKVKWESARRQVVKLPDLTGDVPLALLVYFFFRHQHVDAVGALVKDIICVLSTALLACFPATLREELPTCSLPNECMDPNISRASRGEDKDFLVYHQFLKKNWGFVDVKGGVSCRKPRMGQPSDDTSASRGTRSSGRILQRPGSCTQRDALARSRLWLQTTSSATAVAWPASR